ncbi:MAG: substrate-binding domain-containing protein [Casimicrobium sp.]
MRSFLMRCANGSTALSAVVALTLGASAFAADITLAAAGAGKELAARIDAPFSTATGHRIKATFDTVGAQRERVERAAADARPDAVLLSAAAIAQLNRAGLIDAATIRDIGDVQVGLAVKAGSDAPDISTPDALRAALLAAPSIAYADPARGATAGAHFAKTLVALGIHDRVAAKVTVLPFGVEVIEAVGGGKFALGVSQSSEIVQHKSVRYVGALPVPHQLATRYQIAALKDRPNGARLAEFFATDAGKRASRESGFVASN